MNKNIFRLYDIRGIYPQDFDKETVKIIGQSAAKLIKPGKLVLGYDGRFGSPELADMFAESFKKESAGRHEVIMIGLATTPMLYFTVKDQMASGGCMVTASHNPKEYNGFLIIDENLQPISGPKILGEIK